MLQGQERRDEGGQRGIGGREEGGQEVREGKGQEEGSINIRGVGSTPATQAMA